MQKSLPSLPEMLCSRSLKHDIDELVAMVFPRMRLAVVDDTRTARALGDQVFRALKSRFECLHLTLEGVSAADDVTAAYIRNKSKSCDALIAVGSGTVSDLCKYASFQDGKPYIVFPTAATMNGYLSANASITIDGYKKTLPAQMPRAVFCDLSVIAAAPVCLNKSGLGDALARPTAQADWLLSHLLLNTPYTDVPFSLLKPLEAALFENARGIARGDAPSIELLLQTLLLSGFGMTIAGGSYPASQ
ncbi:MAG: iron-containing alcohol dehydrogenase, partial [Pseudomonadota bacterium]|nr:iron-containing alcohol dehydrogenase [Pseudomonadota bacterium]